MRKILYTLAVSFLLPLSAIEWCARDPTCNLLHDLQIVKWINERECRKIPVTYNHLLQGGYFQMPSARIGSEGEIGFGYSHVFPYYNWNARVEFMQRLEVTVNYRVFRGVLDNNLSKHGFGWFSDKGANIKFVILDPEWCDYCLPGIAVGANDFIGTRAFKGEYLVATQLLPNYNLELSLGMGGKRYTDVFGGVVYMPFWQNCRLWYLQDFALVAEYDPTRYKNESDEPNEHGRSKSSSINFGAKYRFYNFDFSVSRVRGEIWAASISTFYNLGERDGFFPKYNDPLPYRGAVRLKPIDFDIPEDAWTNEMADAFCEQGFDIYDIRLSEDHLGKKTLRIKLYNNKWNEEPVVHARLTPLLASFVPPNVSHVVVTLEGEGFAVQEYHFPMHIVRDYDDSKICSFQYRLLARYGEIGCIPARRMKRIYHVNHPTYSVDIFPRTHTFFGSAKGKFKYSLGVNVGVTGFLFNNLYYSVLLGKNFINDFHCLSGRDLLNPSQLPNVRTDSPLYLKNNGLIVEEMYVQLNRNFGAGLFGQMSAGLFEMAYGGIAFESLYYPVNAPFAFGFEAAFMKKRNYTGIGFSDTINQFSGTTPNSFKFKAYQGFFNFYYDFPDYRLDFHLKAGKFLANDLGARFELTRYYPSGMRLFAWYTFTNGHDRLNGHVYYDKGVGIILPMDYLLTYSNRKKLVYGMSAWLRDVGAYAFTGNDLYWLIRDQRACY